MVRSLRPAVEGAARITSAAGVGGLLLAIVGALGVLAVTWSRPGGRTALRAVLSLLVVGAAAAGARAALRAGGASAPATPSPLASSPATCSPRGRVLRLVARGIAFDATCLAAPAGRPSVIEFRNEDPGIRHNVAISTDPTGGRELFRGRIVEGPGTTTYRLPSLEPGTYFFRCDIHPPQMHGTFVVA